MRVWLASIMVVISLGLEMAASGKSLTILKPGQIGSWTVNGVCKRLVIANEDHKADCTGGVRLTLNDGGIASLAFAAGQKSLIFRSKEGSARLWQGDKTIFETDGATFDLVGQEGSVLGVLGTCDYVAASSGRGYVNCMGLLDFKIWAVTVETDGDLPIPSDIQR